MNKRIGLSFILFVYITLSSWGANRGFTWTGTFDGTTWDNSGNWSFAGGSGSTYPDEDASGTDTVLINTGDTVAGNTAANLASLEIDGSSNLVLSQGMTVTGAVTITTGLLFTNDSNLTVDQNITGGGELRANAGGLQEIITVGGNFTVTNFTANESSVVLDTATTSDVAGYTFYDLEINAAGAVTSTGAWTVSNSLTLTGGTWNAGNNIHQITGAWNSSAVTFNADTSTIRMTSANPAITTSGIAEPFNNLTLDGGGSLGSNIAVSGTFDHQSATALSGVAQTVQINSASLAGDITLSGAGTITFTGGGTAALAGTTNLSAAAGTITFNNQFTGNFALSASTGAGTGTINVNSSLGTGASQLGSVSLTSGAINLGNNVRTSNGTIDFTGPVTLTGNPVVNSTGGDISFSSTIDGTQNLTVNAGSGTISLGGDIGNTFNPGNLTLTSTGGAINLPNVTITGNLSVTAGGAVTQSALSSISVTSTTSITATGFAITLSESGNDFTGAFTVTGGLSLDVEDTNGFLIGAITVTNAAAITSGGAVNGSNGAGTADITSASVNISANSGIGNLQVIDLAGVDTVTAAGTVNGNINISNTADAAVTVSSMSSGSGTINYAQSGNQSLALVSVADTNGDVTISNTGGAGSDITCTLVSADTVNDTVSITAAGAIDNNAASDGVSNITGAVIVLSSGTDGIGQTNGALDVNAVTNLDASSGGGDISIDDVTGDLPVGLINAGAGDAVITSAGAVSDSAADGAADIVSADLNLTSQGAVSLDINVTTLTVSAAAAGNISLDEVDGLTVTSATTTAGTITITSTTGNIAVDSIVAGAAGDNGVTLTSTAGNVSEAGAGDGGVDIDCGALVITAVTGVGSANAIETEVTSVDIQNSTSGSVQITESDDVTILNLIQSSANNNIVFTSSAGTVTVDSAAATAVSASGTGSIDITASGAASDLIFNDGLTSGTGTVTLTAGRNVTLNAVTAGGILSVTSAGTIIDTGTLSVAGALTLDAGGSTITLDSPLNTFGSISAVNATTVEITENNDTDIALVTASSFDLRSAGSIIQSGAITLTGAMNLRIKTNADQDITLNTQDNDIDGTITLYEEAPGSIRDYFIRNISAVAAVTDIGGVSRNVEFDYPNTGINFESMSIGGTLTVTAGGAVTQSALSSISVTSTTSITATGFAITLSESGNDFTGAFTVTGGLSLDVEDTNGFLIGAITVTNAAAITSGGAVNGSNGAGTADITSASVNISANSGIGNLQVIDLAGVDTVTAAGTVNGNINISNTADAAVTVSSMSSGSGTINYAQSGNQSLALVSVADTNGDVTISNTGGAGSDITCTLVSADTVNDTVSITAAGAIDNNAASDGVSNITGAVIVLSSGTDGIGQTNGALDVNAVTNLDASSGGGDISIDDVTGDLPVGLINAGAGDAVITSAGAVSDSAADGAADIVSADLNLTSQGAVSLDINVTTLTVSAAAAGNISLDEVDGLTVTSATTTAGTITITSTTGNIAVDSIVAGAAGDNGVTLTSTAGNVSEAGAGDGGVDIDCGALVITAVTGVGSANAIETEVTSVDIQNSTSGSVQITESDDVTILNLIQSSANNNIVFTSSAGTVTVDSAAATAVSASGTGSIDITASGAASDLIFNDGLTSGTGTVTLTAGRNVTLNAVTAGGILSVTSAGTIIDTGTLSVAGALTLDAGGSTITLDSPLNTFGSISAVNATTVEITENNDTDIALVTASSFDLRSAGSIIQSGAITLTGAMNLRIKTNADQDITLNTQDNDIDGTITLYEEAPGSIRDYFIRNISAVAAVTDIGGVSRNVEFDYPNTGINFESMSIGGTLTVTAGGAVTQSALSSISVTSTTSITATGFAITLSESGNDFTGAFTVTGGLSLDVEDTNGFLIGAITVTNAAAITSGGAVNGSNGAGTADITSASVNISANSGIGNLQVIDLAGVDTVTAAGTVNGNINISNTADAAVTVSSMSSGSGTINYAQSGNQSLALVSVADTNGDVTISNTGGAGSDITCTLVSADTVNDTVSITAAGAIDNNAASDGVSNITGAVIVLSSGTDGIGQTNGALDVNAVTNLDASSGGGDISIDDVTGDLPVGLINAGAGDAVITSAGAVSDSAADGAADIVSADLNLTSQGAVSLDINVTTLTVSAAAAGNISLDEVDGLTVTSATTTAGTITITSTTGNIAVDSIVAGAAGDNGVTLTSTAGNVSEAGAGDGGVDIDCGALVITAVTGVGSANAIETEVTSVDIQNSTSGSVQITESDDVTILNLIQSSANNNIVFTSSAGTVTVDSAAATAVSASGTGSIDITATGALSDVIIENTISGQTGAVTVTAGRYIDINSTVTSTTGQIEFLSSAVGPIYLGADITTSGGSILFSDDTVRDGAVLVTLSTGAGVGGNITFTGTLNGNAAYAEDLTVLAGTGSINFGDGAADTVGAGTPVGDITVTGALNTRFYGAVTADSITQTAGTGTTQFDGALILRANGTVPGTGLSLTGSVFTFNSTVNTLAGGNGGTVTIDNGGLLTVITGADFSLDGAFTQTGAGDTDTAGNITTTDDAVSFAGAVTLTGDISITTAGTIAGNGITFSDAVDGDFLLTLSAASGDVVLDGAAGVLSGLAVTSSGSIDINSTLSADDENIILVSAGTVDIADTVTTTNNGTVTVTNGGLLTIVAAADMSLDGAFLQNGAGAVITAGDITTTADNIDFISNVTLTGAAVVAFSTGAGVGGNITFTGTLNGNAAYAEDLTVLAGTGSINFGDGAADTVGAGTPVGDITVTGALNTRFYGAVTADSITQTAGTGTTQFDGALILRANGTVPGTGLSLTGSVFTFNSTVNTLAGGNGGTVTIDNGGLLTVITGADFSLDGAFTQTGAGDTDTAGNITTTDDAVSFAGAVTLTGDISITTAGTIVGNGITFSDAVDGDFLLTLSAASGDVVLDGAAGVLSGLAVTSSGSIDINSTLSADDENIILVSAGTVDIADAVTTTNNGTVTVTNGGLLTLEDGCNMTLDGAFLQNGAGESVSGGGISTTNDTVTFTATAYLAGSTDNMTFNTGAVNLIFLQDIHIYAPLRNIIFSGNSFSCRNFVLYSGNINLSGNDLAVSQDFVAFGSAYDSVIGTGVADLFTYDNPARSDDGNFPGNLMPNPQVALVSAIPGTAITFTELNYAGSFSDLSGSLLNISGNFYVNGCNMTGTGNWTLSIPDNDSITSGFAEAYNMSVSYSQASPGWVSAGENVADNLNNSNWEFSTSSLQTGAAALAAPSDWDKATGSVLTNPYPVDSDNAGCVTVYDNVIRVEIGPSGTAKVFENSSNEISRAVAAGALRTNNGTVNFTGSFIDRDCTTSTDGQGDISVFYLQVADADTWNTDASGTGPGNAISTDMGRPVALPAAPDLPSHKTVTADIFAPKGLGDHSDGFDAATELYLSLLDSRKNRITHYPVGSTFTGVTDHCRPVVAMIETGRDNNSATEYNWHNYFQIKYSEPVDIGTAAAFVAGGGADNVRAMTDFTAAGDYGGYIHETVADTTVTAEGYFSYPGRFKSGTRNPLDADPAVSSLFRGAPNAYGDLGLRIYAAGHSDGTTWTGFMYDVTDPNTQVAAIETNDQIIDANGNSIYPTTFTIQDDGANPVACDWVQPSVSPYSGDPLVVSEVMTLDSDSDGLIDRLEFHILDNNTDIWDSDADHSEANDFTTGYGIRESSLYDLDGFGINVEGAAPVVPAGGFTFATDVDNALFNPAPAPAVNKSDDTYFSLTFDDSALSLDYLSKDVFSYDSSLGRITDLAGNLLLDVLPSRNCMERVPPTIFYTIGSAGLDRVYVRFSEYVFHVADKTTIIQPADFTINGGAYNITSITPIGTKTSGPNIGVLDAFFTLDNQIAVDDLLTIRIDPVLAAVCDNFDTQMYDDDLHRISDFAVGLAEPVWAADSYNADNSSYDSKSIRDFTGKDRLQATDITLEARINTTDTTLPLTLFYDADVPSGVKVDNFWLPTLFAGYNTAANSSARGLNPFSTNNALRDFLIPESDSEVSAGKDLEFIFNIGGLYAGRLLDSSDPRTIAPWKIPIRGIKKQRSGVTILNNVINVSNGEKTILKYDLSKTGTVTINIFSLSGDVVKTVFKGRQPKGSYSYTWDGTNAGGRRVARGIYFVRVVGPDIDEYRKVIVVKD